MRMNFECYTNYNLVALNALKIKLASGSVLTIDRDKTEWSVEENGRLSMEWKGVYLWAIDDCNIFSDFGHHLNGEGVAEETAALLKGAREIWFEYDGDLVDHDDYAVQIISMGLEGKTIYERLDTLIKASAVYTGGSVWVFYGQTDKKEYFIAESTNRDVSLFDADPSDLDDSLSCEWQEEHLIRSLDGKEIEEFFKGLGKYLRNYPTFDIVRGGISDLEIDMICGEEV